MKFFSSMSSVGRRLFAPGAAARPPAFVVSRERRPAREIATREPVGSEWSISRPALALPPPTGTAARPPPPTAAAAWLISYPGHCTLIGESTPNFARNSPGAVLGFES